jgi:DNA-binding NtrC family response regulator
VGRSLCFIGDPGGAKSDLFGVFSDAGLRVRSMAPARSIAGELETDPPAAVVLGAQISDRRAIIASLQERSSLRQIPVLSQVIKPDQDSIERVFQDGADDFLFDGASAQLSAMAAVLEKSVISEISKAPNGLVLLAEEDRFERIRLGRVLKRNGFDIHFEADLEELRKSLNQLEPRAVISSAKLPGGSLFKTILEAGDKIYEAPPWVIIKTEQAGKEIAELISSSKPHPTVVFDKGQDAERLTFLMNEILTPPPPNVRRSQRLLYGAPVLSRNKGTEDTFTDIVTISIWTACSSARSLLFQIRTSSS